LSSDSYVTVDTLFHLPEVYLYVVLVDLIEKRKERKRHPFQKVYTDVREAIDSVHGDGTLKQEILADLGKFVRRDKRLPRTLEELRRVGKQLFLLTNSEYYYTDALLGYLLGGPEGDRDWRALFDLIVTDAGKPAFFTEREPDRPARPMAVEGTETPIFREGTASFLERETGFHGDQILYFGDHTYGDILRSKKSLGWRTAMVVEELAQELDISRRLKPQLDELNHWKGLRNVLESDISVLELQQRRLERKLENGNGNLEKTKRQHEGVLRKRKEAERELKQVKRVTADLGEQINKTYNRYWGPVFREGQETSRFGHQVKDFACLYMTSVTNLIHYTASHYFRSAVERMPHELE
jgi:hypothetical protein